MSSADETAKREGIIKNLLGYVADIPLEGVLLQGSMVYGKNYCVTANSDIDLLVILAPEYIHEMINRGPFAGGIISEQGKQAFADRQTDCMWDGFEVDGITINPGYLSLEFFAQWTKLSVPIVRRSRLNIPPGTEVGENRIEGVTVLGTPIEYTLSVALHNQRYDVEKPVYYGEQLIQDQLYGSVLLSEVLLDKSGQISSLIRTLGYTIKEKYGARGLLNLLEYGLHRASPEFLKSYLDRMGCSEFGGEYTRREA